MRRKWLSLLLTLGLASAVGASLAAESASADTLPFQDQYQNGTLTLCDKGGKPITSGSVYDLPFVWTTVSSTQAPHGYTKAVLYVYQPIEHVDPSGWAGYEMTAAAVFSNLKHPMTQATYADNALIWAERTYPPYWDGLYELRMYFTSPNASPSSDSYPAAVIRITGSKWTQLTGGGGSCTAGRAVSVESIFLPKSKTETPRTVPGAPGQARPASGSGTAIRVGQTSSATATPDSTSTAASPDRAVAGPATGGRNGGGSAGWIALVAGLGGAAITGGGIAFIRRKRQPTVVQGDLANGTPSAAR